MAVNVSEQYREIIYSGGAINRAILTINDTVIPNENIKRIVISSPIIDKTQDYFCIGTFLAQKVEIQFKNADSIDLTGNVNLSIGTLVDDEYEDIYIGEYIIDTTPEDYFKNSKITCYDKSILFKPNVDISQWFDEEEYIDEDGNVKTRKTKVRAEKLLIELCKHFLGENKLAEYPNVNLDVTTWYYDTSKSGKYYISKIAEIMGCNAKIGRDGRLYMLPLKREPAVSINALQSKSWTMKSKYKISRVFWQNGNIVYERGTNEDNALNLSIDNVFIYEAKNDIQTIVNNVYEQVNGFEIYSLKNENYGDVSLDCWDIIDFELDGEHYTTFNDNEIIYEMNISTTIDPEIPTKQNEEVTNYISNLTKTTNLMKTEIFQNSEEIKLLASKIVDVSDYKVGWGSVTLENAMKGSLHKLSIRGDISLLFPQTEFQYGFPQVPKDGLKPHDGLVPSNPMPYGNEVHYPNSELFTKSNKLLVDDVEYELDFDFLNYLTEEDCDELVIEDGKQYIIRRLGLDENGELYKLDEPITEPRKDLEILVEENSTISLKSFNETWLTATYLCQNQYTDIFATQVYVDSEIKQTTDEINIQVAKKCDKTEVVNQINVSTDQIKIKGNRFLLEADNLTIDETGNIYLNNGAKVVGGDGLLSNLQFGSGDELKFVGIEARANMSTAYQNKYSYIQINAEIPPNFKILSAKITLIHSPVNYHRGDNNTYFWGYCRKIKLYKTTALTNFYKRAGIQSELMPEEVGTISEISGAFGSSGFTASVPSNSSHQTQVVYSSDIKDSLTSGWNRLVLQSSDTIPSSDDYMQNQVLCAQKTGTLIGVLNIYGYTSFN